MTVLERLKNDKKVQKGYDQLITLGLPIETITNTITFGGFVEGLWTVDIAELMKPPLMGALLMYANEKGLPMVMYNNDKDVEETPLDNMSNYELMRTMKENIPVAFEEITAAMDKAAENKIKDADNKVKQILNAQENNIERIKVNFKQWKLNQLDEVAKMKLKGKIANIDKAGLKEILGG